MQARQIVLAARPESEPGPSHFRLEEFDVPAPRQGDVVARVLLASADPSMRWRMNEADSYTPPFGLGEPIGSHAVCEVVESRHDGYSTGDLVVGPAGWRTHATLPGDRLRPVDAARGPDPAVLGVLGMPGFTAYAGMTQVAVPRAGETLVVAAAAGPVGATVAQMAAMAGLRVVAIAGGPAKCAHVRDDLGIETVLDHRDPGFDERLVAAVPDGVDVYFENVGGAVARAVFPLLNDRARVPLCGMVADYNRSSPEGAPFGSDFYRQILVRRLEIRGFLTPDFVDWLFDDFIEAMERWVDAGLVKHREDVTEGLEHAPDALIGLLRGDNLGKAVVRIAS